QAQGQRADGKVVVGRNVYFAEARAIGVFGEGGHVALLELKRPNIVLECPQLNYFVVVVKAEFQRAAAVSGPRKGLQRLRVALLRPAGGRHHYAEATAEQRAFGHWLAGAVHHFQGGPGRGGTGRE
nr:hypothetical protein [Tanacetum cinerariifolium]